MHKCRSGEIGRRTGLKIQRASRLVSVRLRPSAPLFSIAYRVKEIKNNSLKFLLQALILSGRMQYTSTFFSLIFLLYTRYYLILVPDFYLINLSLITHH